MELGTLTAIFSSDTRKFDAGARSVQAKVAGLTKDLGRVTQTTGQFTSALGPASSGLTGLSTSFAGAAGTIGIAVAAIGAATAGVYKLATFSQQLGGEIFDLSQKINFTAETLSSLKVAAELSGGSMASLSTALGIFDRNMEEAKDKTSEMSRVFAALKIDTEDNEKAIREAFKALASMASGAQQTALAMKLFGRSGKEVLGIVKETEGNVDNFIERMREMGLVITTDGAKKADQFGDQLVILQSKLEAIARQIGTELVPTVSKAADDISRWLKENQSEIIKTAQELSSLVSGFYSLAKVVSAPFVAQIIIMRRLIDIPAGGVAGIAGSIGASVAGGLGASPEALRRAGRISAQGEGEGEFVIPGSSVPSAAAAVRLPGGGGGGGGRRGGGGRSRASSRPELFDEIRNLEEFYMEVRKKAEEAKQVQRELLDDILGTPVTRIEALIKLYDTMRDAAEAGDKLLVGSGVLTATGELEKFMQQEPPEISKQSQSILDMREKLRDQMQELAGDLTGILDRSIYDGIHGGAMRGLQSLATGLLDLAQTIILGHLKNALGEALGGAATGSGFFGGLLRAIFGGAIGGAAGGLTGGGAIGNSGPVGSGIGNFARGGYLPPGKWGVAGENGPERIYGGVAGMTVTPGVGGGQVVNNHYTINMPPPAKGSYASPQSKRQMAAHLLAALQGAQS